MTNKTYDTLKWIAQILLPALATFAVTICTLWGFDYGELIAGTIMAVDTLLGAILGISSHNYNKEGENVNI